MLLMGRFEEADRFRAALESIYPDDPSTWLYAIALASVTGKTEDADRLVDRIGDRFGDDEADVAEAIADACALVPELNAAIRGNLSSGGSTEALFLLRVAGAATQLLRVIEENRPDDDDTTSGVSFFRLPPALIEIYRPLWEALRGGPKNLLKMKRTLPEVAARSAEGSLPAVMAFWLVYQSEFEQSIELMRRSMALPSGILERRTILLENLLAAAVILAEWAETGEARETFCIEVRRWVDEACDLPAKTASECYAIFWAGNWVDSPRLPELTTYWHRLAPTSPEARLAFAEQQLHLRNYRLVLGILETVERDGVPPPRADWAKGIREARRSTIEGREVARHPPADSEENAGQPPACGQGSVPGTGRPCRAPLPQAMHDKRLSSVSLDVGRRTALLRAPSPRGPGSGESPVAWGR